MNKSFLNFDVIEEKNKRNNSIKTKLPMNEGFEFEIIDSNINSDNSLISDDTSNQNPTNFLGTLMKEVFNMTNVIKFNIISTENKFSLTLTQPIQILDKKYNTEVLCQKSSLVEELQKFIWFSYRSNFEGIVNNNITYTSDAGWGCMIRVGQMILAKGIFELFRFGSFNDFCDSQLHLFLDNQIPYKYLVRSIINETEINNEIRRPNKKVIPYYSIQEICKKYSFITKAAGQWYSNYDMISIFQNITDRFNPLSDSKIINFQEGTMYISHIIDNCFEKINCKCCALSFVQYNPLTTRQVKDIDFEIVEKSQSCVNECHCFKDAFMFQGSYFKFKNKFIMFISVRHGLYEIEEEYTESILRFFDIKHNIGIIGGKNQRALYFIGYYQDNLICLDPHFVQNTSDINSIISGNGRETFKPSYYSVNKSQISPTFTLGFYCGNIGDFRDLMAQTLEHSNLKNQLFSVREQARPFGY